MHSRKKYGLSAKEKIKNKKDFEKLYSSGKTILTENQKLKAIYIIEANAEPKVKFAAVVSKKLGKAVWRNRVKRLIRESYRLNKHPLVEKIENNRILLKLIISAKQINEKNNIKVNLEDIMPEVVEVLRKIPITKK